MHSLRCQRPCMQSAYFCLGSLMHAHADPSACMLDVASRGCTNGGAEGTFSCPSWQTALETAGAAARFGPALAAAVRPEQDSLRERERGPILSAGSMGCRLLQYALGLGLCLWLRLTFSHGLSCRFSLGLGFPLRLGNFLELLIPRGQSCGRPTHRTLW